MKRIRAIVIIALMVGFVGCEDTAEAPIPKENFNRTSYIVAVSLQQDEGGIGEARDVIRRLVYENAGAGDRVTVMDALTLKTITTFDLAGNGDYSDENARMEAFEEQQIVLAGYLSEHKNKTIPNGDLSVPSLISAIRQIRGSDNGEKIRLILLGSPIYHSADDFLGGMDGGFLPDGVFAIESLPFFTGGSNKGALKQAKVYWVFPQSPFVNEYHAAAIKRFWGVYFAELGASLAYFGSDPAVMERVNAAAPQIETYTLNPNDLKMEVHPVESLNLPYASVAGTVSPPPPSSKITTGGVEITFMWPENANLDIDGRVKVGNDPEVFWNHRRNEGQVPIEWKKDRDTGFETIIIPPGVAVDLSMIEVYVNLYAGRAPHGAKVNIFIKIDGRIYSTIVHIKAHRGDLGLGSRKGVAWRKCDILRMAGL